MSAIAVLSHVLRREAIASLCHHHPRAAVSHGGLLSRFVRQQPRSALEALQHSPGKARIEEQNYSVKPLSHFPECTIVSACLLPLALPMQWPYPLNSEYTKTIHFLNLSGDEHLGKINAMHVCFPTQTYRQRF
jgi:hypothetical protein